MRSMIWSAVLVHLKGRAWLFQVLIQFSSAVVSSSREQNTPRSRQRRCLDRGVFCSLEELMTALEEWIKLWNEGARPFKWTKTADQIIDRICRYCRRISEPAH